MLVMTIKEGGEESEDDVKKYAKKCGYSITKKIKNDIYISFYMKKNKIGQPPKKLSKDEILLLREKGNTIKDICKVLGVSRSTIYNYLK